MHRLLLASLLLLSVLVRLPSLGADPLDAHHVRQADTSSMARVMARDGVSLWTPRIGWAGPEAGAVEAEFPLYATTVGAVWSAMGSEPPWVPRTLSLLAWLLGGVALARLCRRWFEELPLALPLALYALSPLGVLFSRSVQPDALAVSFLVLAWERADASRAHDQPTVPLLVSAGLLGIAIASKGPVALWLPVVAFAGWRGLERVPTRIAVGALALAVVPPAIWYVHAHQLGADGASFKLWGADSGKWSSIAALSQPTLWRAALRGFLSVGLTPLGVGLALTGVVATREQREFVAPALGVLAAVAALFILLPAVAAHEYYLLPMLPFASVLVGGGAGWLWREAGAQGTVASRVVTAGLLMALMASSAQRSVRYLDWGWTTDSRIADVATAVRAVLPSGTATVVVDQHPQTLLYAIDQRGWHRDKVSGMDVRELRGWGAEALLVTNTSPTWRDPGFVRELLADHPLVARGDGWTLVRLDVTQ